MYHSSQQKKKNTHLDPDFRHLKDKPIIIIRTQIPVLVLLLVSIRTGSPTRRPPDSPPPRRSPPHTASAVRTHRTLSQAARPLWHPTTLRRTRSRVRPPIRNLVHHRSCRSSSHHRTRARTHRRSDPSLVRRRRRRHIISAIRIEVVIVKVSHPPRSSDRRWSSGRGRRQCAVHPRFTNTQTARRARNRYSSSSNTYCRTVNTSINIAVAISGSGSSDPIASVWRYIDGRHRALQTRRFILIVQFCQIKHKHTQRTFSVTSRYSKEPNNTHLKQSQGQRQSGPGYQWRDR